MGPFVNSVACLQKDHKKYPNLFCFVWLVNPEDSEKGLDIFWVWISEVIWSEIGQTGFVNFGIGIFPASSDIIPQLVGFYRAGIPMYKKAFIIMGKKLSLLAVLF